MKVNKKEDLSSAEMTHKIAYLEHVISLMPGHVYWKDRNGIYLGCNDLQAFSLGYKSGKEIVGKTDFDLPWHDQAAQLQAIDREVIEAGNTYTVEEPVVLANGSHAVFLSKKVPLYDESGKNIIGILGISIDITDRKKDEAEIKKEKEKAEKANRAKSEFLAIMSHELRTPLNGVMGAAQILASRRPRPEQKEFIDDIYRSGNVLLALINDVLDLSKLEAGKLEFVDYPCDLKDLIEEMISALSHLAKEKGLKLLYDYKDTVPRYIVTDSRRLRQLLFNLVGNALKYTDKGHVLVRVECLQKTSNKAQFKISVIDTGVGIPPEKLNFVFDRFSQVEPSYCGTYRGTGLGLAIVKQMVENIGGSIYVKSRLNEGSTFWCVLTFALQDDKSQKIFWPERYRNTRVLVVNDDKIEGDALLRLIAAPHGNVVSFQGLLQVLSHLENEKSYDVIIMDGFHNGEEINPFLHQLSYFNCANKIALFLLSNKITDNLKKDAKKVGIYKCLPKPIRANKFVKLITHALDKKWIKQEGHVEKELSQLQILLVEDNPINQKVAKVMLEQEGCRVDVVPDGKSAIKAVQKPYDVIFMDIGLPDIDGYEVTKHIRQLEKKKGQHVPIIAMTANAFEQDKQKCFAVGMDDFISKPVTQQHLHEVLVRKLS